MIEVTNCCLSIKDLRKGLESFKTGDLDQKFKEKVKDLMFLIKERKRLLSVLKDVSSLRYELCLRKLEANNALSSAT